MLWWMIRLGGMMALILLKEGESGPRSGSTNSRCEGKVLMSERHSLRRR